MRTEQPGYSSDAPGRRLPIARADVTRPSPVCSAVPARDRGAIFRALNADTRISESKSRSQCSTSNQTDVSTRTTAAGPVHGLVFAYHWQVALPEARAGQFQDLPGLYALNHFAHGAFEVLEYVRSPLKRVASSSKSPSSTRFVRLIHMIYHGGGVVLWQKKTLRAEARRVVQWNRLAAA